MFKCLPTATIRLSVKLLALRFILQTGGNTQNATKQSVQYLAFSLPEYQARPRSSEWPVPRSTTADSSTMLAMVDLICSRYSKQFTEVECRHFEDLLLSSTIKTLRKHLRVCSYFSNIRLIINPRPEGKETEFT